MSVRKINKSFVFECMTNMNDIGESGFKRKKVESLTLGERLQKIRSEFRTSLTEISRTTKIPIKYLEALELGQYEKLPADVYVKGFLRAYARHFGVDEAGLLKLYEKEQRIRKNMGREREVRGVEPRRPVQETRFIFTSRGFVFVVVGILIVAIAGYLYREFQAYAAEPYLVIESPENGSTATLETIFLKGKTDIRTKVFVNEKEAMIEPDGAFEIPLVLRPGTNTIRVEAVNRFGKRKEVLISVRSDRSMEVPAFEKLLEVTQSEENTTGMVSFEVSTRDRVNVLVESDDLLVYSGALDSGSGKVFQFQKKAHIRTDNGNATLIRFNGGPFEPVSEDIGTAEREYFAPKK